MQNLDVGGKDVNIEGKFLGGSQQEGDREREGDE
jgi:hypothetical protein